MTKKSVTKPIVTVVETPTNPYNPSLLMDNARLAMQDGFDAAQGGPYNRREEFNPAESDEINTIATVFYIDTVYGLIMVNQTDVLIVATPMLSLRGMGAKNGYIVERVGKKGMDVPFSTYMAHLLGVMISDIQALGPDEVQTTTFPEPMEVADAATDPNDPSTDDLMQFLSENGHGPADPADLPDMLKALMTGDHAKLAEHGLATNAEDGQDVLDSWSAFIGDTEDGVEGDPQVLGLKRLDSLLHQMHDVIGDMIADLNQPGDVDELARAMGFDINQAIDDLDDGNLDGDDDLVEDAIGSPENSTEDVSSEEGTDDPADNLDAMNAGDDQGVGLADVIQKMEDAQEPPVPSNPDHWNEQDGAGILSTLEEVLEGAGIDPDDHDDATTEGPEDNETMTQGPGDDSK